VRRDYKKLCSERDPLFNIALIVAVMYISSHSLTYSIPVIIRRLISVEIRI
jgi:hypothetical protein